MTAMATRNKTVILIPAALLLYTVIYIAIVHSITENKLRKLELLEGKAMTETDLHKEIRKGLSEVNDKDSVYIRFFSDTLKIQSSEKAVLYKVNGKGIPNYIAAIILDTTHNQITNVSIYEYK